MICLFDKQESSDAGIVTRFRRARRGYKGFHTGETVILGIKALTATIDITPSMPMKTVQKRIGCAAERLRAERTRKVLFSETFPYRELVLREGFEEIDDSRLLELFAGRIASVFSGREKVAAFFARRLTGEAENAFCQLCRDYKYVMAAVESDDGRLYQALGRRLGISVIGQPTEKQLSKADVAVFFSPPERKTVLPDKCVAIPVMHAALSGVVCRKALTGMTVELPKGVAQQIPDGFAHEPLIAAAIDAGALVLGDIPIRTLKIKDMYA
jgi:hypothetical protein